MAQPATTSPVETPIENLAVAAYKIPTEEPESDGTYQWDATTLVMAKVSAGGMTGLGYSYADRSTAVLIRDHLREIIIGRNAMDVTGAWQAMVDSIRNLGRPGIASMAIAAVDTAMWDLKARVLEVPLSRLLGQVRDSVPAYGSGGFTSYSPGRMERQLGEWSQAGMRFVKMKIGREPERDMDRIRAAREALRDTTELFVDANGAYGRKQALDFAHRFTAYGVTWFEEPVSSDDLEGLSLIRDGAPQSMEIAAGEYGYDLPYFRRMLGARAVDVLQADATRCGGITGFLDVAALCKACSMPLSAHTAPTVHSNICCSVLAEVRHIEYFHDHQRIEHMLFDGAAEPWRGDLRPNGSEPGLGIAFRETDAKRYAI